MPTRVALPATPTAAASPGVSPVASPIAPTIGSPVSEGTPASLTAAASTMTREEFKAALQSAFPFEAAANQGGSIVFGSPGDISTTNPLLMSDLTTFNILSQVFEPL